LMKQKHVILSLIELFKLKEHSVQKH